MRHVNSAIESAQLVRVENTILLEFSLHFLTYLPGH
jgi:hypothetical protein